MWLVNCTELRCLGLQWALESTLLNTPIDIFDEDTKSMDIQPIEDSEMMSIGSWNQKAQTLHIKGIPAPERDMMEKQMWSD